MSQIDEHTLIPVSIVAALGVAIWRSVAWLLGISAKVDLHTTQIGEIKKELILAADTREEMKDAMAEQSERVARIETKIDFIVEKLK